MSTRNTRLIQLRDQQKTPAIAEEMHLEAKPTGQHKDAIQHGQTFPVRETQGSGICQTVSQDDSVSSPLSYGVAASVGQEAWLRFHCGGYGDLEGCHVFSG